ncbi:S8 family peptidase [bacterium]|nr:S8 family peptidase [bacterium]
MKKLAIFLIALCGVLALVSVSSAGELSDALGSVLASKAPGEKVTVWIKLPPVDNRAELKRIANESAMSREQRHESMIEQLKSDHARLQASLLSELRALEQKGLVSDIRTYWISNIVVATVETDQLEDLASRFDVDKIYLPPQIKSIVPEDSRASNTAVNEANAASGAMRHIRADSAWAAGYTGQGRLICTFDSGVDGDHNAIAARWKGLDGNWRAAWFDPVDQDTFPHVIPGSFNFTHGTRVMGVAVGCDPTSFDTTGVAPDAKWISAAVTDLPSQVSHAILEAFEWAADPDGNPNTISDVPDVINHSWGFTEGDHGIGCEDIFFDAIDNIEALGIVNIFAAGNEGPTAQSIANPANRALDSLDCFAVGASRVFGDPLAPDSVGIALFSSRGPSICNLGRHKPNVVAPGYAIRTSNPGGTYVSVNGTSFSAPAVAGLVALLKQKNPNATVDQIKTAILTSTDRSNFSSVVNDSSGWGEINCLSALNALSATNSQPNVRIYDFTHTPVSPGDTIEGTLTLINTGSSAVNVTGIITSTDPMLTVLNGSVTFGTLNEGDTASAPEIVRIAISDQVPMSSIYGLPFDLSINGGAAMPMTLSVLVAPGHYRAVATHDNGTIRFTVSNFGTYGMGPISMMPLQGAGFDYKDDGNYLWEGGLILSTSSVQVSSGVHSYIYASDNDFRPANDGYLRFDDPGAVADQQSFCAFIDSNNSNPIGVRIIQETFSFDPPNDDFIIMRYILVNEQSSTVNNLRLGLMLDWDVFSYLFNAGGYDEFNEYMWTAYNSSAGTPVLSDFRGVRMLEGTLSSAQTFKDSVAAVPGFGGNGFLDLEKYLVTLTDTAAYTRYASAQQNLIQVMAAGPMAIDPGARDTVAFAILGGDNVSEIANASAASVIKYAEIKAATDIDEPDNPTLPTEFALRQNYPNPFNPTTTIMFDLPVAGEYQLTVYNTLGQEVDRITGRSSAGTVSIEWDGGGLASGVYLYKVTVGDFEASRKMLLLK